ncbi:NADH oxidase, partial [Porticoccaceae bacterium]|nr:NADH oxidase [Porticoccaceae bacterium]
MSDNSSKEIRSTLTNEGILELSIVNAERPVPGDDEVLLKIEASPINPSDLALLITFAADLD